MEKTYQSSTPNVLWTVRKTGGPSRPIFVFSRNNVPRLRVDYFRVKRWHEDHPKIPEFPPEMQREIDAGARYEILFDG